MFSSLDAASSSISVLFSSKMELSFVVGFACLHKFETNRFIFALRRTIPFGLEKAGQ